MAITPLNYTYDKIENQYRPGQYPGERIEKWELPDDIRTEYSRLNSIIETKYSREYLKICAFYNKLFPSLRSSGYITTSYNVPPFTAMDQERTDTGTGISSNYLKQIVDQIVARIGTATFEPMLIADVPSLEYIIYKDDVERLLRKSVRDRKLVRMMTEVFHDAAVVGFSHVFIDPITHQFVKANDYEVGMFESQLTKDDIVQMLYRNYNFPSTSLGPYIKHVSEELRQEIIEDVGNREWVDFKMFFDCPGKRVVITIGGKTLPDIEYPFDKVQMATFCWDVGFSKVTATSLFDLLYPCQRELNRVNDKIQQLIRMYKGAVPVFNSEVDLTMKNITNGSGEALYVDSARPLDTLMTVINPTPLDAQLVATKTEIKTEMYELAGIQQVSFDAENFRSAAAVVAADQFHDTVFQAQLSGMAQFISQLFRMQVYYNAVTTGDEIFVAVNELLENAEIDLKPVTVTSPLGSKNVAMQQEPNYIEMATMRACINILKGRITFNELPFTLNKQNVKIMMATAMVKLEALGLKINDNAQTFMIEAFIDDIKKGIVKL